MRTISKSPVKTKSPASKGVEKNSAVVRGSKNQSPRRERRRAEAQTTQPTKTDKAAILARIRELLRAEDPHGKKYDIKHPNPTLLAALEFRSIPWSIIPIVVDWDDPDEAKKAAVKWKPYQDKFPTTAEILEWFDSPNPYGIGIIHGVLNGGSEVIDVDDPALVEAFEKRLEDVAPGLLSKLIIVRTPRDGGDGGRHYYYTFDPTGFFYADKSGEDGNQKLAQRKEDDGSIKTTIETRGEGGYTIAAGSPPKTHPTGKPYQLIQGEFTRKGVDAARITFDERATLLEVAHSFNEYVNPKKVVSIPRTAKREDGDVRPGEAYDQSPDAFSKTLDLLERNGWKHHGDNKHGVLLTRPGKRSGVSATLFDSGNFYVFSSNAHPFEMNQAGESYSPFAVLTYLEYDGDFSACAKALYAEGYGERANGKARDFVIEILGGKLKLRVEPADRGKVKLTALDAGGKPIHQHEFKISKSDEREKFVKAVKSKLDLKDTEQDEVREALLNLPDVSVKAQKQARDNDSDTPTRFYVNDSGVYVKSATDDDEGKGIWLCSPLHITARARDENGDNVGLRLEWTDFDGNVRHWTMPRALLSGDGAAIREELLSRGFGRIATGRYARERFTDYLMSATPEKVVRNTARIGWHNGAYILPDETIGAPDGEETVLQSNANDYRLTVKGSLEEWRENVSKYCEGNSRLLFAASVAFAAPLLRPLGQEGGGFHFRGQSSKGKSTTTIVAGSIYGGGDPLLGYARTWAHTANALEATAEMHNDGLLILDELARCDAKDAGNVAYMLASGDGKGRLQSSVKLRKSFKWQLMFLSTGEISLADHVAQSGKKTRAGQEVRLCDLPADTGVYGVFENLHGFADGSAFAKTLQQNSRAYYGAAIRAYLKELTGYDMSAVKQVYEETEKEFTEEALKIAEEAGQQISGEVARVLSRFALIAYAGELASSFGVTGWAKDAAKDAALTLFKEWLVNRGGTGNADEEAMVSQVRRFLAEYGSLRFESSHNDDRVSGKRAGFIVEDEDKTSFNRGRDEPDTSDEGERKYCIFTEVFKSEVCAGYDTKDVAKALAKRGFLERGKDGKNPKLEWSPTEKRMVRVYVVSSSIFGE